MHDTAGIEGNAVEKSVPTIYKIPPFLFPCNLITNECCDGRRFCHDLVIDAPMDTNYNVYACYNLKFEIEIKNHRKISHFSRYSSPRCPRGSSTGQRMYNPSTGVLFPLANCSLKLFRVTVCTIFTNSRSAAFLVHSSSKLFHQCNHVW